MNSFLDDNRVNSRLNIAPSRTIEPPVLGFAYGLASPSSQSIVPSGTGRFLKKNATHHFVVGYYQMVPSSFAPPSLRCGAAFVLRARRSSKSEGGLQATADGPGRSPLRMLLSFVLTCMGGCRTRLPYLLSKLLTTGELSQAFSRGSSKSKLPFSRKDLFGLPDCLLDERTIFCGPSHRRVPALIGLDTR
jgi:hypothetical protein